MSSLQADRSFFEAGVDQLENYLLSPELYWPLSGKSDQPRLTIGALLLADRRLQGSENSPEGKLELVRLRMRLQALQAKWRSAWENKSIQEFRSRFQVWKDYLDEYRDTPDPNAADYPQRVRGRAILQLLGYDLPKPPVESLALKDLDHYLREALLPGTFCWEPQLVVAFPGDEYWFLYGKLKAK